MAGRHNKPGTNWAGWLGAAIVAGFAIWLAYKFHLLGVF